MRHIACIRSASACPTALSSAISTRRDLFLHPLMNFRGAQSQSSPIQTNRNAGAAADALQARFHSLSEGEIMQRNRNLQQLGRSGGSGDGGGGGRGLSSGDTGSSRGLSRGLNSGDRGSSRGWSSGSSGEANSRWNVEQQQQQEHGLGVRGLSSGSGDVSSRWNVEQQEQGGPRRGEGEQRRGKEESAGLYNPPRSRAGDRFGGGRGDGGGWWGGRGEGRVLSRGRGGGRRGDWRHQVKSNGWERQPAYGDRTLDGEFSRSRYDEDRRWCHAESELPAAPHEKFVLVSYNILADKNAFEHYNELYYPTPRWLMNWDRRRAKLVEELGIWSPDIMCLQEVDKYGDLQDDFQRMGYRGAFKGRTGGARDGCAMFWKTSRFRLLEEVSIQFNELDLRDNVAQLCVFQSIASRADEDLNLDSQHPNSAYDSSPGSLVIVGNIHVLFNPKRGDVKLGQVRVLLESAHELSEKYGGAPVTIAGDFNSTPTSDLYKYISTSELDVCGCNRATMSGQVESGEGSPMPWMSQMGQSSSTGSPGAESPTKTARRWIWTPDELLAATGAVDCTQLRHSLQLRSAYTQIKGEVGCRDDQGEPLVTTFHRKFMGTVDYIWHTEGIDTVKVLDTLPVNLVQRTRGLPSQKWGSDHLALACELAFLPGSKPSPL